MEAVYYGHSSVAIHGDAVNILFDPFITLNEKAKHIDISQLQPEYIFLSHCHGDHVADMMAIQQNSEAQVVCIVETGAWVERQGVPTDKVTAINFGGTLKAPFGSAKLVFALHTNSTPEGD